MQKLSRPEKHNGQAGHDKKSTDIDALRRKYPADKTVLTARIGNKIDRTFNILTNICNDKTGDQKYNQYQYH